MLMANSRSGNRPEERIEWALARLCARSAVGIGENAIIRPRPDLARATVEGMVRRAIDYIEAGDIYQANVTQRFSADLPESFDRLGLYSALRRGNPATFAAFLEFGQTAILSSSPERFLRTVFSLKRTVPILRRFLIAVSAMNRRSPWIRQDFWHPSAMFRSPTSHTRHPPTLSASSCRIVVK
jgi:anthranilate/para-aminobenzoate synthase component I